MTRLNWFPGEGPARDADIPAPPPLRGFCSDVLLGGWWALLGVLGILLRLLDLPGAAERCLRPLPPGYYLPVLATPARNMHIDMAAWARMWRHGVCVPVCDGVTLQHRADMPPDEVAYVRGSAHRAVGRVEEALGCQPRERVLITVLDRDAWSLNGSDAFATFTLRRFRVLIRRRRAGDWTGYAVRIGHEYAHAVFRSLAGFGSPLWVEEGFCRYAQRIAEEGAGAGRGGHRLRPGADLLKAGALGRADALCERFLREGDAVAGREYGTLCDVGHYVIERYAERQGMAALVNLLREMRWPEERGRCLEALLGSARPDGQSGETEILP